MFVLELWMMLIFSSLMDVVEIQSLVDVVEIQLSARSVDSMHSSLPFLFCPQTSKVSVPKLALPRCVKGAD